MIDIHNYEKGLVTAENAVRKSNLSERNKEIILKFEDHIITLGLSKPRTIKYLNNLRMLASWLEIDFDKATKDDIKRVVKKIKVREDYSAWTKHGYCVIIKRFYKWLYGNDEEYPKEVNWITNHVKKKDLKLPGEGDLLTEDDVKRMIKAAKHPRDKALIAVLYESGCRIGEIASLQMKHVTIDKHGVLLTVFGKTGSRKIRIITTTTYLMTWLECHELRDDKEAPLWLNRDLRKKTRETFLSYRAISELLKTILKDADIKKRVYPHLFRHSRATMLANHLTEFQMNQYFGWAQGSNMPSTYVHLSGRDLDGALLKLNGLEYNQEESKESTFKPRKCPRCMTLNGHDSSYCKQCSAILDEKLKIEMEQKRDVRDQMDKMMDMLMQDKAFRKVVVEKMNNL
jgi:integrase/recombinase XerD